MKLFEIINTPIKNVTTKGGGGGQQRLHRTGTRSDKSERLGSGSFGTVERHENLPQGSVVKYGTVSGDIRYDGYVNFLTQISRSDRMARNPYLPRIYSVKIMDERKYSVVMEELKPFNELRAEEYEAMAERMFGGLDNILRLLPNRLANRIRKDRNRDKGSRSRAEHAEAKAYMDAIPAVLNWMVGDRIKLDAITDPKLKEAIMITKKIVKLNGGISDLSMSNIMVRRGPTGAQLVITDPLV
jgi:hypothetical protein